MIEIECTNQQTTHAVEPARLTDAVRLVLTEEGVAGANLSVAVVDDPTIHVLNRRYLQHDYPTDVISFVLDPGPPQLTGEVIVSADMAAAASTRFGWRFEDELLLYVIHGTLHLVGYDDLTAEAQVQMRTAERRYLLRFGLVPRYDEEA